MSDVRLQELARLYAAGQTTWREIADEIDVAFGDLLLELARQGLALPTAAAPKTPEQQALWDEALRRAAAAKHELPTQEEVGNALRADLGDPAEWEKDHATLKAWLAKHRGRRDPVLEDDGELTDEQLERIRRIVREQHGEGVLVRSLFDDEPIVPFREFAERIRAVAAGRAEPPEWAGTCVFANEHARQEWLGRMLEAFDSNRHGGEEMPGRADLARPLTTDDQQRIKALVGRVEVDLTAPLPEDDDETDARPQHPLLTCSDDQLAATMARFEELEKQMWPVLAALGHELDADQVPTRSAAEWLLSRSPAAAAAVAGEQPGKWVVEREGQGADGLWALVHGATLIGRLWAAKCSGLRRATFYGGRHAVIIYVPGDLEAARAARAVLRELGVAEPLRYLNPAGDELLRE